MITNRPIAPNKGRKYPAEPLQTAQVDQMLALCSPHSTTGIRNRALLMLLYRSGLRVSEVLAVRPTDIDVAHHSVRLLSTKSGRAQTRGFHPSATDSLMRWMDRRKQLGNRGGTLFVTLAGRPVSDDYVRVLLRRLGAQAGIDRRVHPHALRHTYAAELVAANVPVTVIRQLLGHSHLSVTIRYIDHLTNRQAINVLEATVLPEVRNG
jgi:site-specific recombinase XerD